MARPRRRELLGRIASFLAILAAIWLLPTLALAPVIVGGAWTLALVALLATPLPIYMLIRLRNSDWYPGKWFRLLVLRPFWYVQLCVLLLPIGALLGGAAGLLVGTVGAGARLGIILILLVFAAAALWGYLDSRRLRLVVTDAIFPDLPEELDGLRIVQLSDLHVGPHSSPSFMRKAARLACEAAPDMIAVTGDLVDDFDRDVEVYARYFADLAAPLGVWIVPGNHDVYANWPRMRERLTSLPQAVLVNEWVTLERGGTSFALTGTGDPAGNPWGPDTAAPRLDDSVDGIPGDMFTIALAHNPSLWPGLVKRGVHLTLSGHTHWGQFAVPGLRWSLAGVFLEHAMGAYREGRSMLYVSPGTNYWGVPFRLGAPPEVGVVILRRGEL
ncbi:MAG TPA: metallophosphoesterase [Gemmatimonadales bacterium]|nr:metallophosphoesterase [Gemmatimonadales bacterium]